MSILTVLIARNPRDQRCPRTAPQRLCRSPMLPLGRGFSRPCTHPRGRGQQEADAPDTAPWKHLGGSTSKLSPRCFDILALYLFMDFGCHGNVRLPPSLVPPQGQIAEHTQTRTPSLCKGERWALRLLPQPPTQSHDTSQDASFPPDALQQRTRLPQITFKGTVGRATSPPSPNKPQQELMINRTML